MSNQDETRTKWERLKNPETLEDYGLSISMEDLLACPEIAEEISTFLPAKQIVPDSVIKECGERMAQVREQIFSGPLLKKVK